MISLLLAQLLTADGGLKVPFEWRLPNVVSSTEVPGITESNGVPVKMHSYVVKGSAEEILADVIALFDREGLWVQPLAQQPQLPGQLQVTGFDPELRLSYTAMIQPSEQKRCSVIVAEANVGYAADHARESKGQFAPLPPDVSAPLVTHSEGYEMLSFTTGLTPSKVAELYARELVKLGYAPGENGVYRRKGEEIRIQSVAAPSGATVVLLHRR